MLILLLTLEIVNGLIFSNKNRALKNIQATQSTSTDTGTNIEVSLMQSIYIEYTDAFQIVLNSNYPMFTERALQSHHNNDNDNDKYSQYGRLIKCKKMMFTKPVSLGHQLSFYIHQGRKSSVGLTVKAYSSSSSDDEEICFTATGAVLQPLPPPSPLSPPPLQPHTHKSSYITYPDEIDHNYQYTTRTIFNLLERGRSDVLGGPLVLATAITSGVKIVVARVNDYNYYYRNCNSSGNGNGSKVSVLTNIDNLGLMVNFHQAIVEDGSDGSGGVVIATATVSCMCVDDNNNAIQFPSGLINTASIE